MATKRQVLGISLPQDVIEELRKFREETGIPVSKQVVIALRQFWSKQKRERIARIIREEGDDYAVQEAQHSSDA